MMRRVRRFGLQAPIPLRLASLPTSRHDDIASIPALDGHANAKGFQVLAYWLPRDYADGYLSYLDELLPYVNVETRARELERAALNSVDDMVRLWRNGYAHTSLVSLSHNGAHWEWDYWRWVWSFLGKLRWGPSSIRDADAG